MLRPIFSSRDWKDGIRVHRDGCGVGMRGVGAGRVW